METVKLMSKNESAKIVAEKSFKVINDKINELNTKFNESDNGRVYLCYTYLNKIEAEFIKELLENNGFEVRKDSGCFIIDYTEDCKKELENMINGKAWL